MEPLDDLTEADFLALIGALRSGKLPAPFSALAVGHCVSPTSAGRVAAYLEHLREEGMQPRQIALLVEAVARTRSRSPRPSDFVDLVWTGPEAPGVHNRDTGVVVRDLFGSAEREVVVAGFAVYRGRSIFQRLAERMTERHDLRVKLFLDVHRHLTDTASPDELLRRFAAHFFSHEWPGDRRPELYYDPRSVDPDVVKRSSLHAKCIVVDRRVALVTSANFTEAAQERNIEVGTLIRDEGFASRLAGNFETLADVDLLKRLTPARES